MSLYEINANEFGFLRVITETTGYAGGDGSITTVTVLPDDSLNYISVLTEELADGAPEYRFIRPGSIQFMAHGDAELNGLRQALHTAAQDLDRVLARQDKAGHYGPATARAVRQDKPLPPR